MKRKKLLISLLFVVALVVIAAVPVMAATTDTTEITGEVVAVIDVTAPSDINLGTMALGDNLACSATPGTVTCNAEHWQVTAEDEKISNTGYMTSGANVLANKFQLSETGSVYANADDGITYGNPTNLPLCVKQVVTSGDPAGSYAITITFTGTIL